MHLFGIPNCNTVKKARDWLAQHSIDYTFHDFKKEPPTEVLLNTWLAQCPWETLINRTGMTWRNLSDDEKAAVKDHASAIQLMKAKSSVIKRPVLVSNDQIIHIGFDEAVYKARLS